MLYFKVDLSRPTQILRGKMEKCRETLHGVLTFHSETGTEGGYWAFQDKRFIRPNTTRFSCKKCYLYWDKEVHPDEPPIRKKKPAKNSIAITEDVPSKEAIERQKKCGKEIVFPPKCAPNTHDFHLVSKETWDYEGLHLLKNGDHLIICDPENPQKIVWEGVISLRQFPPFTEHVFGLWIHAEQQGVNREKWAGWFLEGHPAMLIKER